MKAIVSIILTTLLVASVFTAVFGWWMESQVLDSDVFIDTTVQALGEETSRVAAGQLIVRQMVAKVPVLTVIEPRLVRMFAELIESEALGGVVTRIGVSIHERVISGNRDAIVLNLVDHRDVILAPIAAFAPRLAEGVSDEWFVSIEILGAGILPNLSPVDRWIDFVRVVSAVAVILLASAVILGARRRGIGLAMSGAALVLAGIGSAVAVPAGRWLAAKRAGQVPVQTLLTNTYNGFTGELHVTAILLTVFGVGIIGVGLVWWSAEEQAERRPRVAERF